MNMREFLKVLFWTSLYENNSLGIDIIIITIIIIIITTTNWICYSMFLQSV